MIYPYYFGASTPAIDGHRIVSITNGGGSGLLFTTAAPHGLSNGTEISVTGNSVAGYNQTGYIVANVTSTTFTASEFAYSSDGAGGTWALV